MLNNFVTKINNVNLYFIEYSCILSSISITEMLICIKYECMVYESNFTCLCFNVWIVPIFT